MKNKKKEDANYSTLKRQLKEMFKRTLVGI